MLCENNVLFFINVYIEVCWIIYYVLGKFFLIKVYCYKVNYGFFFMNYSQIFLEWLFERFLEIKDKNDFFFLKKE